eukprot:TRINITY_DN1635_c0_g1_i1.p1 TRINITY_DN1635_c0_g1~~TRINITY_DN1635_c0_g1_i1.p1  ORF type:complete len:303 (+),score=97.56 TRINITY_DN1635_c0_g1_i1:90-998(+)
MTKEEKATDKQSPVDQQSTEEQPQGSLSILEKPKEGQNKEQSIEGESKERPLQDEQPTLGKSKEEKSKEGHLKEEQSTEEGKSKEQKTKRIGKEFYKREDTVVIAKELLGKYLMTKLPKRKDGTGDYVVSGGMIVETEAYCGMTDEAVSVYMSMKKNNKRGKMLYEEGGVAYVYMCYGVNALLNIVTNKEGEAHAVLIRAIQPEEGISTMLSRRWGGRRIKVDPSLTSGPGSTTKALGINTEHTGTKVYEESSYIWVEDRGVSISEENIIASARVGIPYAGSAVDKPWRFRIHGNKYVSKAK